MDTSSLEPRVTRSSGGVMGDSHGALKNKSTWTDEDGIGQVKRNGGVRGLTESRDVSTSRRPHGGQAEKDSLGGLALNPQIR